MNTLVKPTLESADAATALVEPAERIRSLELLGFVCRSDEDSTIVAWEDTREDYMRQFPQFSESVQWEDWLDVLGRSGFTVENIDPDNRTVVVTGYKPGGDLPDIVIPPECRMPQHV